MVMGDLVLLETEINPVMTKLIENGIEITAIHNHLLRGSPATFYMHIGGHGDPVKLATAIRTALAESKTPLTPPAPPATPPAIDLDTAQLDQIIGAKGQANGGVYQFGVPRRDPITENGMQIAPAGPMGRGHRDQLPADRRRQGRHHRRLRADRRGGEPGDQGAAGERHRGDGDPQPHADRAAAADLHALLGERRRAEARPRTARRARQDRQRQELSIARSATDTMSGRGRGPPSRMLETNTEGEPMMSGAIAHAPVLMQVAGLAKRYRDQTALADISFAVNAGEVLGLIGPNGAGKTTLLEAIAGLIPADDGRVLWRGAPLPLRQRRERMFYLPDGLRPWEDQYVARVIGLFTAAYGRSGRLRRRDRFARSASRRCCASASSHCRRDMAAGSCSRSRC